MQTAIAAIVTSIILYVIFKNIKKCQFRKTEFIFVVSLITVLNILLEFLIPLFAFYAITGNIIFVIILIAVAYRKNKNISLSAVYSIFSMIIFIMSANIASSILTLAALVIPQYLAVGRYEVMESRALFVVYLVIMFTISYFISRKLGRYLNERISVYEDVLVRKLSNYILCGAIITLCVFFSHTFLRYFEHFAPFLTLSYALTLAICFGYLMFAIFAFSDNIRINMDLKHKDELLQDLRIYTERLDGVSLEARQFRHDHRNLMIGFNQYLEKQDWKGLQKYHKDYMREFEAASIAEDAIVKKLSSIRTPEINSILLSKCMQAQQQGTSCWVEVRGTVTVQYNHELLDICRIIGIFMDNALESCKDVENAELRVLVAEEDGGGSLFVFENTCSSPPPITDIFKKNFSTKKGMRGMGLYKVSQILSQNRNITLKTTAKDGTFTQKLKISM